MAAPDLPSADIRLRRLRFRAWRRGFRELDLVLGGFVDRRSAQWGNGELDVFEGWLDIPDQIFYAWVTGRESPPPAMDGPLFRQLVDFACNYSTRAHSGNDSDDHCGGA